MNFFNSDRAALGRMSGAIGCVVAAVVVVGCVAVLGFIFLIQGVF